MLQKIKISLLFFGVMTLLTGIGYPLLVTAMAQVLFPFQANGSMMAQNNQVLGSQLIGQPFRHPGYFWGRLSATAPMPYNAAASGGSNFGPSHPDLIKNAKIRLEELKKYPVPPEKIPVDLITSSASGLDPHISVAAARYQAPRIAQVHGLSLEEINSIIEENTESRTWAIWGEPRVHVLRLNLQLSKNMVKKGK